MNPEKKGLKQIVRTFGQKVDYFFQGRNPEEDARIKNLAANPSNISQKDRYLFMSEQIAEGLCGPGGSALRTMLIERYFSLLPQDKLDVRVIEDAVLKAKLWGLIPKAQQLRP